MRERGQIVKKGTLSEDGDVEFWEDGSSNVRTRAKEEEATAEIGEGKKA
jgi:protein import protein ZIM17